MFIFAGELTHFQRSRLRRCLPIDMARRILRHILANSVQIGAASAHKTLPLPAHQGQDFEKLVRCSDRWIYQYFTRQRYVSRFSKKGKGKPRGQAEAGLAITSSPIESQMQVRTQLALRR